jgi:hypothetical protein
MSKAAPQAAREQQSVEIPSITGHPLEHVHRILERYFVRTKKALKAMLFAGKLVTRQTPEGKR